MPLNKETKPSQCPEHSAVSGLNTNINELEQFPYLPELAPCDFFLITKLKRITKGTRFEGMVAIKRSS